MDLSNLSDLDFEILTKDIMQKKLSQQLYRFIKGKDKGIDICDNTIKPNILIQAKHYQKSGVSKLISSLKNEIAKVKQLNPKKYYISTSVELTRDKKTEIIKMFKPYMKDLSYILDLTEISDFLNDRENEEILHKHYKIWLAAFNILSFVQNNNIFIDCCELVNEILDEAHFYVETNAYRNVMNILSHNSVVIVVGVPGIGKSTISKMALLRYAHYGYEVRYASDNNIADIKRVLSQDPEKKEIVLLDDFLGQHYLELDNSQQNAVRTLISFIERQPNKKIIINSRITILNEARAKSIPFESFVHKNEKKYLINIDDIDLFDKARILYNHLYFNNIPDIYSNIIKANARQIVSHKNYNPRIVAHIISRHEYIDANSYEGYVFETLSNPKDIWKDEFENRIDETDRIFMSALYSLTDTLITKTDLEKAFNKRIRETSTSTTINIFESVLRRLNQSLIRAINNHGEYKISVLNPSVNDYLKSEILNNTNEQIAIIKNAEYLEQIDKVATEHSIAILEELVLSGRVNTLSVLENNKYYYFLKFISKFNIRNASLNSSIVQSIENCTESLNEDIVTEYSQIIVNILTSNYYDLSSVQFNLKTLESILVPMELEYVKVLFEHYKEKVSSNLETLGVYKSAFIGKIISNCENHLETEINSIVSKYIYDNDIDDMPEDDEYIIDGIEKVAYDSLEEWIYEDLEELDPIFYIQEEDIKYNKIGSYINVSAAISAIFHEDDRYDEYKEQQADIKSYNNFIDMLFNR